MRTTRWIRSGRLAALIAAVPAVAAAQDENAGTFPRLDAEVLVEIQNDYAFDSDVNVNERNDLFTTTEPFLSFKATRNFKIESGLVLEPVRDSDPGDDRFFEDHGLFAETLYAAYETDRFMVKAGKYNPSFGTAWDAAPGIYGVDFAEDYELTERIGAAASYTFVGPDTGEHTVTVNSFFADTTFLSQSAFAGRGDLDKSDGGPSNTEDPSSLSVTLGGGGMPAVPVDYHLGARYQEGGPGTPNDETGVVAGISGSYSLMPGHLVEPIAEVAYFDDFAGTSQDRTYLTTGFSVLRGPFNVSASYTGRFIDANSPADGTDTLAQLTAGYALNNGLTLDAGYRYEESGDVDTHIIGALVTYTFTTSIP
mgnify:CR=1 FL=1